MVKHKKKRSKQGLFSKAINAGLIALGFSRVLELIFTAAGRGGFGPTVQAISDEATFGLMQGKLDLAAGARMYLPAGAAAALGGIKSYALKKFPVR